MRELLPELHRHWSAGEAVGLATVVRTFRSAPRPPGAAMAVLPEATVVGSVSGGCVEGAVFDLAAEARGGAPAALHRYGISDETAASVGLSCGGIIDVFVEPLTGGDFPEFGSVTAAVAAGEPVAVATVLAGEGVGRHLVVHGARPGLGPHRIGSLGSVRRDDAVADDASGLLRNGQTAVLEYGPDGERRGTGMTVFVHSFAPQPRMIVFGATDFAAATARVGGFLGYRVTVCDARPAFATATRFPDAEVVVDWPHRYLSRQVAAGAVDERTVVCVLTHDPKFDVPLLSLALRLPLGFVGAMGSRQTHETRLAELRRVGLTEEEVDRLSSPVGLDIGARTPAETAVSIAAEMVARQWGGTGQPLSELAGPIHHDDIAARL